MGQPPSAPGDTRSGNAGCATAAVAFLAVGLGFGSLFAVRAWRDVRVFTVWKPTTCTILATQLGSTSGSGKSGPSYRPEISFRYEVGGKTFTCTGWDSWALSGDYGGGSAKFYGRVLDRYEVGATSRCWYDPGDPSQAVLVRRIRPLYVLAVLPLAFAVLGAVGLYSALAKPGRRLAAGGRGEPLGRSKAGRGHAAWDYRRLAVRLAPETTPGTQSCGAFLAAVALLFVGFIAGYAAWSEWQDGNLRVIPLLFVIVFGGLGLLFLWIAAASAFAARVPATIVEIERRSVAPGESVDALVLQPGPLRLRSLRVRLVGKVETPAESRSPDVTVLSDELVSEVGRTAIGRDVPMEHRFTLRVPADARPSQGGPPRVWWRLEIRGVPLVWPRFMLAFPIMVEGGRSGASPPAPG
ncbi:MAG: DUF3592 domain-containing protein [Acidobacteria bacterium]|nr:MAG: DUF3592 domain-containing protein [Acidobacteriota bacterium]